MKTGLAGLVVILFLLVVAVVPAPAGQQAPVSTPGGDAVPTARVFDGSNPAVVYGELRAGVDAWRASLGKATDQWGNEITGSYVSAQRPDFVAPGLIAFLKKYYASDLNILVADNAAQAAQWRQELAAAAAEDAAPCPDGNCDDSPPNPPGEGGNQGGGDQVQPEPQPPQQDPSDDSENVPDLGGGDNGDGGDGGGQQPADFISACEAELLRLCNEARKQEGLQPYTMRQDLVSVARQHSGDMLSRNYFDHYTPEGQSPSDRVDAAGISYTTLGENVHRAMTAGQTYQEVAAKTFNDYKNSPRHWSNIMSPDFTEVGFGYAAGSDWMYNTQVFIRP